MNRREFLLTGATLATLSASSRFPGHRNRLFMCGSTSMYSLYVNTQGVAGGWRD